MCVVAAQRLTGAWGGAEPSWAAAGRTDPDRRLYERAGCLFLRVAVGRNHRSGARGDADGGEPVPLRSPDRVQRGPANWRHGRCRAACTPWRRMWRTATPWPWRPSRRLHRRAGWTCASGCCGSRGPGGWSADSAQGLPILPCKRGSGLLADMLFDLRRQILELGGIDFGSAVVLQRETLVHDGIQVRDRDIDRHGHVSHA